MKRRSGLIEEFHEVFEEVKNRQKDLAEEETANEKEIETIEDLAKEGENLETSLKGGESTKIVATDEKIKRFIDRAKAYFCRR